MVGGQTQVQADKREGGEAEAPQGEQRDVLRGFLRSLDFAAGAAALQPGGEGGGEGGGAPPGPSVPPDKLKRLHGLVPQTLAEVGAAQGAPEPEAEQAAAAAPAADKPKDDPKEKEAADAQAAVAALAVEEAESEGPAVAEAPEAVETDEAEAAESEVEEEAGGDAHVQMKAKPKPAAHKPAAHKPGAHKPAAHKPAAHKPAAHKPAAHKPAHHAAHKAKRSGALKQSGAKSGAPSISPDPQNPLFPAAVRRAIAWTKGRPFAKNPFLVKRFQFVVHAPETGVVGPRFIQAVARFQRDHGFAVNGKLVGDAAKRANRLLHHRYGLDKRDLLTHHELVRAQRINRQALRTKHLKGKTIGELRVLVDLPKKGGLDGAFLRAVSAFQRKYHLREGGILKKHTVDKMRAELSDYCDEIHASASAHYGMSTRSGPDGGNLACAYAVNKVLKSAIGHTIGSNTDLVSSVEAGLAKEGHSVSATKAKAGDIIVAAGSHIGIVMGGGHTLSNSSSHASFTWESDMRFGGEYKKVAIRYWRVMRGKR